MAEARNWTTVAESSYPWERDALDFVRDQFPAHEPYRAWSNFEFIADDVRISLARVGVVESVPRQQAANYPISVQDLRTFAAADEVMVRINTADVRMERDLDPTHIAALDEFYLVCVEQASAPRHAGVND